jgi:hypothetical protein
MSLTQGDTLANTSGEAPAALTATHWEALRRLGLSGILGRQAGKCD